MSTLAGMMAAAVAYAVAGALGLTLALPPGYASPIFPAAGLAVALALRFGRRVLPAIWLGSLAINLFTAWQHGTLALRTDLVAAGVAVGAMLQAWAARELVLRTLGDAWRRLENERDIILFLLVAAPLACLMSASLGVGILHGAGIIARADVVVSWWSWWSGDTLGVMLFAPLALTFLLRTASPWKERLVVVAIPLLITLGLVVAAFVGVTRWERKQLTDHIDDFAQDLSTHLERRFVAHQEALASLQRLIEVMPDMSFQEFEHFTRITLRDNRDIFALSYNLYARQADRERLEHWVSIRGPKPDYRIMERNAQKQLVPAGTRPVYVPVAFIAPLEGNLPAIGFDIYSEALRRKAIEQAIQSRRVAVTEPLRLVQEHKQRIGVLMLWPAYRQEGSKREAAPTDPFAFAVCVLKIDEMVQIAAGNLLSPDLVFRITDPSAAPDARLLHESWGEPTRALEAYASRLPLAMANRTWLLEVFPTQEYLRAHRSWLALGVGSMGLLFAGLLQVMLMAMTGRTAVIRQTVEEQTVELMHAKDAAEASERRLMGLTNSANDAILMMDPQGLISFWNPAAERILGFSREEAVGQNLHEILAPRRYLPDHQAAFPEFQRTGRGGAVDRTVELFARRKDGQEIAVALSLAAMQLDRAWHAVGVLRDISDLKRSEAELLKAKEAAEAATIAKSSFLANMSHEIRTPMNGIIGMTGLLLETNLTEEQRQCADIVRASGEALLGLVNDILDFSKIEANKLSLELLDFDLSDLLEDLAASMAGRASEKGIELSCAADPSVPTLLRGDPGRLRQVLANLVGNALKFTHDGEVAVRVSLVEERDASLRLRFSVRDTGIGIPPDRIGLLFEKFSQVDASTTRQYGGTGLGLAISKQLVELMGGEIGVESEPDRGSDFWFTTRLERQAGEPTREVVLPDELRDLRILVVDDNTTSLELLVRRMASWKMRPTEARDGNEALEALRRAGAEKDPFRLAVIDVQLPDMSGEELARAMQAQSDVAPPRMVMLTFLGMRHDSAMLRESGFSACAFKPIRQQELRMLLSQVAAGPKEGAAPYSGARHSTRDAVALLAGRKGRVLLAEDNITNQQVALGLLRKLGISADAVANGAEALEALSTLPYDVVLMDVQMPQMDGLDATRRIRGPGSAALNPRIPIIALTAHATQADREGCLAAGMDDYLTKPVTMPALARALGKWLPATLPVFDRAEMLERLDNDEELAREVLDSFIEDIPYRLKTLRSALDAADAEEAGRVAHGIKGAAATIGGESLRVVAYAMEKEGKAGDLEAARARLPELEEEFRRLAEAIANGG